MILSFDPIFLVVMDCGLTSLLVHSSLLRMAGV